MRKFITIDLTIEQCEILKPLFDKLSSDEFKKNPGAIFAQILQYTDGTAIANVYELDNNIAMKIQKVTNVTPGEMINV